MILIILIPYRFNFAKSVIDYRSIVQQPKSSKETINSTNNSMVAGSEHVLLSFGGQKKNKSGVTVIKKNQMNGVNDLTFGHGISSDRRLWKVAAGV